MNLKDFLATRDKPPELYWSLVLEEGWAQAGIWYIGEKVAEVISTSPPTAWEVESELTGAVDAALSSAVQKIPEEYPEPNKTVFGVSSAWVKDGEIATEKLAIIKKLCSDLSLTPVGFVVLPEAIAHLYKSEEGSPVSAIILGLGRDSLEISVFKLGSLVGNTIVARSVSLVDDVTEGLSRFEGASPLPSRFIVFDGKGGELEEAKETLMKANWESVGSIKFLHTPKAEVLDSERKVLSTSLAGAAEIGDVVQVNTKTEDNEDLGGPEVENVTEPVDDVNPQDLGFTVGEDVSLRSEVDIPTPVPAPTTVNEAPAPMPVHSRPELKMSDYFQKTKSALGGFSHKMLSGPKIVGPGHKKPYAVMAIVLSVLFLALGLFWLFYPKAEIVVHVTPKNFEETATVMFNTAGQSDPAGGVVPAKLLTEEITGEKTKNTTGSKLVGDRAKGTVEIQNGTAFPINLTAGTFLVSSGNLKYSLDESASVSAALSPSSPGTVTVSVTADAIGAEYNLAKDEVFRVGNYPKAEVDATSTQDFSGGSSRQISAVSKDDADSLRADLESELEGSAEEELLAKVSPDDYFIDDLVSLTVASESFDRKVGDESDTLKLSLALNATGVAADREKLLEFARDLLRDDIPSGYVLRDSQISFEFTLINEEEDAVEFSAVIKANFLPQTDIDAIKKQISGKRSQKAETSLGSVSGFTRASVTLKPKFPGIFGVIPLIRKNIDVQIIAER